MSGSDDVVREMLAALPTDPGDRGTRRARLTDFLADLVAELPVGTELPAERVLAEHFSVARMTVREAVDGLIARGLVERVPRRGSFVAQPRFVHTRHLVSYDDDMRARGMTPGGRKVSSRVRTASESVARALGVEPGARYLDLVRLRTADAVPMAITRSQLSLERFPGLERNAFSTLAMHEVLEREWGVRPATHEQRVRAATITASEAELLETEPGALAFEMAGQSRDRSGEVIEVARSLYRADRYEIVLQTEFHS